MRYASARTMEIGLIGPPAPNPHMAAQRAVRSCPHRSQPETCGCTAGRAICGAGRREFEDDERVSFGFCLACVADPPAMLPKSDASHGATPAAPRPVS